MLSPHSNHFCIWVTMKAVTAEQLLACLADPMVQMQSARLFLTAGLAAWGEWELDLGFPLPLPPAWEDLLCGIFFFCSS